MCGIVGYIGKEQAAPILLAGLKKLEYRGYDSAGLAVRDEATGKIDVVKAKGRLHILEEKTDGGKAFPVPAASAIPAGPPMGSRRKPMLIPTARMIIRWLWSITASLRTTRS